MREADRIIDTAHLGVGLEHPIGEDELVVPQQEVEPVLMCLTRQPLDLGCATLDAPPDGTRAELGKGIVLEEPAQIDAALSSAAHQLQSIDAVSGSFLDGAADDRGNLFDRPVEGAAQGKVEVGLKCGGPPFADPKV